ncbi:hypothetical protein INT45_005204 [Circinella minor]|uniref:DDE Tnp4 domain-containing protein n=1 Tax=Circinella minor TaxID=1195481 RepID=A0A8H7RRA3_9FUNG|nr:hypothetical protein INT45_005204 [Circinella minor]
MNNINLIRENPETNTTFLVYQSNIVAVDFVAKEKQKHNEQILRIQKEEETLLNHRRQHIDLLKQISFDDLAKIIGKAVLRHKLVCRDIFYEIFHASPIFMTAERVERRQPRAYESSHWWSITHPGLSDLALGPLVNELANDEEYVGSQARGGVPIEIQVAAVLWRFANSHFGFHLMCVLLNISDGSFSNFTDRFIKAMKRVARNIAHQFKAKDGSDSRRLGKVIGAMDGKLVVIQKPSGRGDQFVDRKNNPSFNLLAVCDSTIRFIYVKCGDSGCVNDARAFTSSALYRNLVETPNEMCMDGTYIIADSAFPVMSTVVPSFPRGSANHRQRKFNKILSASRIVIEHAFGGLTTRWRTLWKHLYMVNIERMVLTIIACCVLHNICLRVNDIELTTTDQDEIVRRYEAFVDDEPRDDQGQAEEFRDLEVTLQSTNRSSSYSESSITAPSRTSYPYPSTITLPRVTQMENQIRLEGQRFRRQLVDEYMPIEEQPTTTTMTTPGATTTTSDRRTLLSRRRRDLSRRATRRL